MWNTATRWDDITRLNTFTLNWAWIIQAFKLLFSHITLSVNQQRPLFLSLSKFNRCWYPSFPLCLSCLRLKFTWTCCLAVATCVCVGLHLTNFVSSCFISDYQQSRYMKALMIVHYSSNNEMSCLSLLLSQNKKSNIKLFANCNITKWYHGCKIYKEDNQSHKKLQLLFHLFFKNTAGIQRIVVKIFQFIIIPGWDFI